MSVTYVCSKCGHPLPEPPPDCVGWTCPVLGCGGLPTAKVEDFYKLSTHAGRPSAAARAVGRAKGRRR